MYVVAMRVLHHPQDAEDACLTSWEKVIKNLDKIKTNLKLLGIDAVIYKSDIFKEIESTSSPCYLCARKRRGSLYAKAEELGCNKIALGHHFDDAIETIMLNI